MLQANITGLCGECSQYRDHTGFAPAHRGMCFPNLQCSGSKLLCWVYCPKWALPFMHFPVISCSGSGSWALHKGTDSVGRVFDALPRSEQLRRPGGWPAHCPRWARHLNHLPGPGYLVSWVHRKSAVSGVLCISSGELISGCSPPGRCQLPRIPGRCG